MCYAWKNHAESEYGISIALNAILMPVLMVTENTSEKSAHAFFSLKNVKKASIMGTKSTTEKVKVNRVYF
jgi:hypothetical protein